MRTRKSISESENAFHYLFTSPPNLFCFLQTLYFCMDRISYPYIRRQKYFSVSYITRYVLRHQICVSSLSMIKPGRLEAARYAPIHWEPPPDTILKDGKYGQSLILPIAPNNLELKAACILITPISQCSIPDTPVFQFIEFGVSLKLRELCYRIEVFKNDIKTELFPIV